MKKAKAPKGPAHAVFSASGSDRWMNCPGSIALSKDAPEPPESIYAKEGTEAHACLEFLLKNRRALKKATAIALKKWGEAMVNHALQAIVWIMDRMDAVDADLLCETRVDSSSFTCPDQFGTVDAAIVEEFGRLTVIDYKYGAGLVVNPEGSDGRGNSQLVYYALGISAQYHHNFSEVELVVIQPRAYHESGETTRSFVMSMDELLDWGNQFIGCVQRCQAAEQDYLNSGDVPSESLRSGSWCKFCPAAVTCPELKSKAMRDAKIVFSDLGAIESVPEPRMIPAFDLGLTLDACERLELWIEKVRAQAYQVLERGGKIGGYKLVDKRAQRKWHDERRAEDEAWKRFGEAAFTEVKLLSPAALEKLSHQDFGKDEIADWVRKHTVKESSGRTMVRDSDQRIAINPITSVFTVIDVEDENKQPKKRAKDGKQKRAY